MIRTTTVWRSVRKRKRLCKNVSLSSFSSLRRKLLKCAQMTVVEPSTVRTSFSRCVSSALTSTCLQFSTTWRSTEQFARLQERLKSENTMTHFADLQRLASPWLPSTASGRNNNYCRYKWSNLHSSMVLLDTRHTLKTPKLMSSEIGGRNGMDTVGLVVRDQTTDWVTWSH